MDEQLRYEHQMNIEAHRDHLRHRGFPKSHPLVKGEISIHPELVGQLHFGTGTQGQSSLPLSHDDFLRFLPEMQRAGMQSSFPSNTDDLHLINDRKLKDKVGNHRPKEKKRSRSSDARPRPQSMFLLGQQANYRPRQNLHNDDFDLKLHDGFGDKKPWYMRDLGDLPSLAFQSRTDSGIGEEMWPRHRHNNKSSFGMILKDKFQKNPNMYFPATTPPAAPTVVCMSPGIKMTTRMKNDLIKDEEDWSDADTLVHNMSEGSFDKVGIGFQFLIPLIKIQKLKDQSV